MSTPNQSGNNPNAAQTTPQNQPANNSTAGNTSSGVSGAGDATTTNSNANGATPSGGQPNANANAVTFSPEQDAEIQRRVDSAAAAARRQATADAERDRARLDAEARGDVQALLDTERREHGETRRQLDDARRQLNALTVALEENLPRPTEVAPRLRGNTIDELRADARSFRSILSNDIPRPQDPPATPIGGGTPQPPTPAQTSAGGNGNSNSPNAPANVTDADVSAEYRSDIYSNLG